MMEGAIGYYGKLPTAGDFVQRRLPAGFVQPWDRWLQASMLAAQQALGAHWLGAYEAAPAWRFLLAPGCIDGAAWLGLVLPSIDRVGRHFPFTLALPVTPAIDLVATLEATHHWLDGLEHIAHAALAAALDMAALDARLAGLAPPPLVTAGYSDDATVPLRPAAVVPLAQRVTVAADLAALATAVAGMRRPPCLFGAGAPYTVLAQELLPGPEQAIALFDGEFASHGWRVAETGGAAPAPAPAAAAELDYTRPLEP